jgi:hypothetical protein
MCSLHQPQDYTSDKFCHKGKKNLCFNACGASMFLGFYASLFEWLASFHGLTPFHVSGLTFNVSGFHVLAAFL